MNCHDFEKYLRKNPADGAVLAHCDAAAVIPVYNELAELPETLASIEKALARCREKVAVILVVNAPEDADLGETLETRRRIESGKLHCPNLFPLWRYPLSGGVGAARKAGMDAFIASRTFENLAHSVICSLDGDTQVEENYFAEVLPAVRKAGALSIAFSHRTALDAANERAIREYERYLDRYVNSLKAAGSPYAFHTVGSALAVRGDVYVQSGGMRCRQAGEDFYFLQAVSKVCRVENFAGTTVHPSPRGSYRVPFGTGPAVSALMKGEALDEIPDAAFEALSVVLRCASPELLAHPQKFREMLPGEAKEFFEEEGFFDSWSRVLANVPDNAQKRRKAFDEWFDGLKTLRFLHFFTKSRLTK